MVLLLGAEALLHILNIKERKVIRPIYKISFVPTQILVPHICKNKKIKIQKTMQRSQNLQNITKSFLLLQQNEQVLDDILLKK